MRDGLTVRRWLRASSFPVADPEPGEDLGMRWPSLGAMARTRTPSPILSEMRMRAFSRQYPHPALKAAVPGPNVSDRWKAVVHLARNQD